METSKQYTSVLMRDSQQHLEGILLKTENIIHTLIIGLFYSDLDTQYRFVV
jgi:hypothetical protein